MGNKTSDNELDKILEWCCEKVGKKTYIDTDIRIHGRSKVIHIIDDMKEYFLKVYSDPYAWEKEIFAYKNWTYVFGLHAPKLIDIYRGNPKAILISRLKGKALIELDLEFETEILIWYDAGKYLRKMHEIAKSNIFTLSSDGNNLSDPEAYYYQSMSKLLQNALIQNLLSEEELLLVKALIEQSDMFCSERSVPCHRDYGPDNWIVSHDCRWVGVIDFEFSAWDFRMNDFARYPHWEWIHKPDLLESLLEGYGYKLTINELKQCFLLRGQYALEAIVWGNENSFYGFAQEGHDALKFLAKNKI